MKKKIITMMLVICLVLTNFIEISYADTKEVISKSKQVEASVKIGNVVYKAYETNQKIGTVSKGTWFIADSKGKVILDIKIIEKYLTVVSLKKDSFRKQVIAQKKYYEDEIKNVKKLKVALKTIDFQKSVMNMGLTSGKKVVEDAKKMSENEFKKLYDPRALLLEYAVGDLNRAVDNYNKFLNKKINTYDDAVVAMGYLEKGLSYSPATEVINQWAKNIESNLNFKSFLSVVSGGMFNGIRDFIGNIKSFFNSGITTSVSKFRKDLKSTKDTKQSIDKVKKYVKEEYKKTRIWKTYSDSKKSILNQRPIYSQIKQNAKGLYNDSKKVNAYATLKTFTSFKVNAIKSSHTSITGKGVKGATVKAYIGNKQLGKTVKVDSKGNYKISIPKQKKNTKIMIKISLSGYKDSSKTITVSQ
ncbi:MAG: Ig-like domain-containing protein [Peptostreptococcaceae bacterium]